MESTSGHPGNPYSMDINFPQDFRCPISMELMKDPVTISTGVTYDRKNIEKWFHTYKKTTCPATMQQIIEINSNKLIAMTPNHTLKRLISEWQLANHRHVPSPPPPSAELAALLGSIDSTPFKVSSLRKLRSIIQTGDDDKKQDFKRSGGVEILVKIMVQILVETSDFASFRACEEALGVLNQVPISDEDEDILQLLMKPDCMQSMAIMLQRGSLEARFCTISIFRKVSRADYQWYYIVQGQGIAFFKSLLEILSDEICTKASSLALKLLMEIMQASKKSRLKAIEAGAISTLIEILPESNFHIHHSLLAYSSPSNSKSCERIMECVKLLCECAEGRWGFVEHGLGIAAVSEKMVNVSVAATKSGVKILWLVASFHATQKVLEEMVVCGAVRKLAAVVGGGGQSATKERAVKMLKMHGPTWRRYPCFSVDVRDYLGLGNDGC